MLAKTIKWTDFKDNEREETFYFNLTQAEAVEWELSLDGGLSGHIERIIEAQSGPEMIKLFQDLIAKTYGERSADGRRFVKDPQLLEEFKQTEAYSILYMELASSAEQAEIFVAGVIPQGLK